MVSLLSRSLAFVIFLFAVGIVSAQDDVGFVEAEVDNATPYVGEPITYTVRLFDAGTTTGKQYVAPNFASFGQIEGQDSTEIANVDGRQYTVISQTIILIPLISGTLTIEPASVIVPETALQSGTTLTSPALTIDVQPLPADSTGTFSGAIGQFTLEFISPAAEYRVGEPFTLQLIVEGTGNLEQSIAPDLPIPSNWRFFTNPPVYEVTASASARKTFDWTVIPASSGEQTIEPIVFTYFDPQIDNYRSISTAPLNIVVAEGDMVFESAATPEPLNQVGDTPLPLRPMARTVGHNPNDLGILYWLLWGIPPIVIVVGWFLSRNRIGMSQGKTTSSSRKQLSTAKGSGALKQLQKDLRKALSQSDAATAFGQTSDAIFSYLSRKFGENITQDDLPKFLGDYPPKLRNQLMNCIETADSGRYAPVTMDDAKVLINRTMQVLAQLDKRVS